MKTLRVNEETEEGNYVIEIFDRKTKFWMYITTEFSSATAIYVCCNLHIATKQRCRVMSRRNNMILADVWG